MHSSTAQITAVAAVAAVIAALAIAALAIAAHSCSELYAQKAVHNTQQITQRGKGKCESAAHAFAAQKACGLKITEYFDTNSLHFVTIESEIVTRNNNLIQIYSKLNLLT